MNTIARMNLPIRSRTEKIQCMELSIFSQRLKDLAVFAGFPNLRSKLHRSRDAGLETLLDYQRLAMLVSAVRYTSILDGDIIEFGTFRGGSAGIMLQEMSSEKTLHLCDSFEGMPEVVQEDNFHKKGDFSGTSESVVRNGLLHLGDNFEMHVGYFAKTISDLEKRVSLRFALAHIDVDLFESVRDCLAYCYPRMTTGGIIILDDYGAPTCLGAREATDKFFADKLEQVVPLSHPAWGCLVGGGDAFSKLVPLTGFLSSLPFTRKRIFPGLQN
jgi:predicted O-methyltransferase YrrM